MRAFPPQICLVFLSSWEMFFFQGMPSLLKKASELLQVLEVKKGWFGVKKQQTLTGKRATNVILKVHFSNKHIRWEVDLTFKVTGRGRIGADGLAFWYTAAKVCFSVRLSFVRKLQNFPLFRAQRVQPQDMSTDLWIVGSDWVFSLTALITTTSITTPTLWPWPTMVLKTLTIRYSLKWEVKIWPTLLTFTERRIYSATSRLSQGLQK